MGLPVVATVEEAIDRLTDRRGLAPFFGLLLAHLAITVGTQSQLAAGPEELEGETLFGEDVLPETLPLALDLPLGVSIALWLAGLVALVTASLFALRALLSTDTPRFDPLWLAVATGHGLVAAILGSVAVGAGLLALVVPGLFLATAFAFTYPSLVVDRANAIAAMRRSWALTRGHRLAVFGVLLAGVAGFVAITFVGAAAAVAAAVVSPLVGDVVNVGFTALAWLFVLAVLASAFDRLEETRAAAEEKWEGVDEELLP